MCERSVRVRVCMCARACVRARGGPWAAERREGAGGGPRGHRLPTRTAPAPRPPRPRPLRARDAGAAPSVASGEKRPPRPWS